MLTNKDAYQRETLAEWPIWLTLKLGKLKTDSPAKWAFWAITYVIKMSPEFNISFFYLAISTKFNVMFSKECYENWFVSFRNTSSWRLCKTIEQGIEKCGNTGTLVPEKIPKWQKMF